MFVERKPSDSSQNLVRRHKKFYYSPLNFNGTSKPLPQFMQNALKRNAKVKWIKKFGLMIEAELNLLCKIGKVEDTSFVSLSSERNDSYTDAVNRLIARFENREIPSVWSAFKGEGFKVRGEDGVFFAINFDTHTIINLNEQGFDLTRLQRRERLQSQKQKQQPVKLQANPSTKNTRIRPLRDAGGGSTDQNRKWGGRLQRSIW